MDRFTIEMLAILTVIIAAAMGAAHLVFRKDAREVPMSTDEDS